MRQSGPKLEDPANLVDLQYLPLLVKHCSGYTGRCVIRSSELMREMNRRHSISFEGGLAEAGRRYSEARK
jgi:hypothetical protein